VPAGLQAPCRHPAGTGTWIGPGHGSARGMDRPGAWIGPGHGSARGMDFPPPGLGRSGAWIGPGSGSARDMERPGAWLGPGHGSARGMDRPGAWIGPGHGSARGMDPMTHPCLAARWRSRGGGQSRTTLDKIKFTVPEQFLFFNAEPGCVPPSTVSIEGRGPCSHRVNLILSRLDGQVPFWSPLPRSLLPWTSHHGGVLSHTQWGTVR
jgi:hypothetical protein